MISISLGCALYCCKYKCKRLKCRYRHFKITRSQWHRQIMATIYSQMIMIRSELNWSSWSKQIGISRKYDERRDNPSDFYLAFYPPSGMRPPFEPRYGGGYSVGRPLVFELGEPSERIHTASYSRQEGSQRAHTVADQEWSQPGSTVEEWRNRFSHGLQGKFFRLWVSF